MHWKYWNERYSAIIAELKNRNQSNSSHRDTPHHYITISDTSDMPTPSKSSHLSDRPKSRGNVSDSSFRDVAVISTINHNVGDDFVREGILYLLSQAIGSFRTHVIHKHLPVTVRENFERVHTTGIARLLARLPRVRAEHVSMLLDALPLQPERDKILSSDLLVQSGAPVYWSLPGGSGSHQNEWYVPLIQRRHSRVQDQVPLLNIGAGTCQPFDSDGSEFHDSPNVKSFIEDFYERCSVTTLRDTLSKRILNDLGLDAPVIPDPSIFARDRLGIQPSEPRYVVLNFMRLGGHFKFDQNLVIEQWEKEFVDYYHMLKGQYPVRIVCHNQDEARQVERILPGADYFHQVPEMAEDYLQFYSSAQFYVGCRVHGAYATASFGRPAFVIGTDTRARMLKEIGLDYMFVNDVSAERLMSVSESLRRQREGYRENFEDIKMSAFEGYMDALSDIL